MSRLTPSCYGGIRWSRRRLRLEAAVTGGQDARATGGYGRHGSYGWVMNFFEALPLSVDGAMMQPLQG